MKQRWIFVLSIITICDCSTQGNNSVVQVLSYAADSSQVVDFTYSLSIMLSIAQIIQHQMTWVWIRNCKWLRWKWLWQNLMSCFSICLERLRKAIENFLGIAICGLKFEFRTSKIKKNACWPLNYNIQCHLMKNLSVIIGYNRK
jgi:hypothetical protein